MRSVQLPVLPSEEDAVEFPCYPSLPAQVPESRFSIGKQEFHVLYPGLRQMALPAELEKGLVGVAQGRRSQVNGADIPGG